MTVTGPARTEGVWRGHLRDRYDLVLGLLVAAYLLSAVPARGDVRWLLTLVNAATLLVAVRTSLVARRWHRLFVAVLVLGVMASVLVQVTVEDRAANGVARLAGSVVLVLTLVSVFRRLLQHEQVGLQTIWAALSVYLLIGLVFAAWYEAYDGLTAEPFFSQQPTATLADMQYFSFVTLTTLGYGDLTAAANPARALATLEAMVGQVFLATVVARLVAVFSRISGGPSTRA